MTPSPLRSSSRHSRSLPALLALALAAALPLAATGNEPPPNEPPQNQAPAAGGPEAPGNEPPPGNLQPPNPAPEVNDEQGLQAYIGILAVGRQLLAEVEPIVREDAEAARQLAPARQRLAAAEARMANPEGILGPDFRDQIMHRVLDQLEAIQGLNEALAALAAARGIAADPQ